jgi:hypothetical protein
MVVKVFLGAVLAAGIAFGPTAYAAPAQWYWNVTIKYIDVSPLTGRAAVAINGTVSGGNCPNNGGNTEFQFDTTSDFFWQLWSVVIQAYGNAAPVNIYTDGTCGQYGVMAKEVLIGTYP